MAFISRRFDKTAIQQEKKRGGGNVPDYILSDKGELYHYGVLGMKWGVRRYQNEDGTLTEAGRRMQELNREASDASARILRTGRRVADAREKMGWEDDEFVDLCGRLESRCNSLLSTINSTYKATRDENRDSWGDDPSILAEIYSDAYHTTKSLLRSIGDENVPSSEIKRLAENASRSFDLIYDATSEYDDW